MEHSTENKENKNTITFGLTLSFKALIKLYDIPPNIGDNIPIKLGMIVIEKMVL